MCINCRKFVAVVVFVGSVTWEDLLDLRLLHALGGFLLLCLSPIFFLWIFDGMVDAGEKIKKEEKKNG